jgi:pimeloyl-ACP methyl ester carboxylesterase
MKWKKVLKHTGKIALVASGIVASAFSMGSVISAWMLVRSGPKRDYDCIERVFFGKLEPLSLMTEDGVRLHAWFQRSVMATSNRWVILLHGYRSDRMVLQNRSRFFARRGYNTLLLHFRGHGSSAGSIISYGFHERKDVKAAIDYLRATFPMEKLEIGMDGVSMGAAAAAFAVAYDSIDPDWVILESCYDNLSHALKNRLKHHLSGPLISMIARPVEFAGTHLFQVPVEKINPAKALEKIRCPALVLAGDAELVLKTEEVESLFQSIPDPKRLVFFPGAGHEDLLAHDPHRYIKSVDEFLREFSSPQNSGKGAKMEAAR